MRAFARAIRLCGLLVFGGILVTSVPAAAQQTNIVVRNDRGGVIGQRADAINRIRALRQRVEIRGPICLSSCTMYLGAGDVCVDPNATLGFHGPSSYGRPLTHADFEYWSEVIADHYPTQLKNWFMTTARHRITGYYKVSGVQLIRMGIAQC